MNFALPGFAPKASPNGKAATSTTEQRARVSDYAHALRGEALWKAIAKGSWALLAVSVLSNAMMAHSYAPRVVGWVADANGVQHYVGEAQQAMTPTEATIDSSLVTYLRDLREIPGSDYRLVDEHLRVAHRVQTVPGSPAEKDELAFWTAHNPKTEARSMTRIIVDRNPTPTCNRLGSSLTWSCLWAEQSKDNAGDLTTIARSGMVTMQHEPVLPTDSGAAVDNAGGVNIYSISHSLVEE